jgi:uncharacterized DUF497 family protein
MSSSIRLFVRPMRAWRIETRDAAIGVNEDWKLMFVVHLIRRDDWIRIIAAREATAKERRLDEDGH